MGIDFDGLHREVADIEGTGNRTSLRLDSGNRRPIDQIRILYPDKRIDSSTGHGVPGATDPAREPPDATRDCHRSRNPVHGPTFWQTLLSKLGAKSKLSTSFHPQTDGQTERTNQTLEQYLRIFSNYPQDNWVELLPMAQFAYNSSRSSTTGRTPFYANYGYEPTAYREGTPGERNLNSSHGINEGATQKVEELRSLHDKLREKIAQGNEKMAQQANRKRIEGPILKGGDRVYLLTKNLPTLRPSKKLDAIRIGPFEVKKRIKEVNYELRLPRNMRIRPVFHISLLEPAPADAPLETNIEMKPDQTDYEVEQLLDVRKFGNQWRYLVKWKNYPSEENSWEPIKCLKDCPKRLEQFHQQNPQKFGSKAAKFKGAVEPDCSQFTGFQGWNPRGSVRAQSTGDGSRTKSAAGGFRAEEFSATTGCGASAREDGIVPTLLLL